MSIAVDMKVEDLLRRVAALERELAELRQLKQLLEDAAAVRSVPPKPPEAPRNGTRR